MAWTGLGRWLSFLLGALLIIVAIPLVFTHETGAAAGWNIFLGLLIAGAVGSGDRQAPRIALFIAILLSVRVVLAMIMAPVPLVVAIKLGLAILGGVVAYDLRRQAIAANPL